MYDNMINMYTYLYFIYLKNTMICCFQLYFMKFFFILGNVFDDAIRNYVGMDCAVGAR